MIDSPFFSVILPTHNGEERVSLAMLSVLNQTFKDWELIIVMDSCTDNTATAISNVFIDGHFKDEEKKVKVITTDAHRDGLARNAGLDAATGEWILFIDDDDIFMHEYCFEELANKLRTVKADVLDFSFVWKGKGQKNPTPAESFVMVWCRAWHRSFIGDNRFNDLAYGSDKEFYERMILNNPNDVAVSYWHYTMYYYNYMREGSLSWQEKQQTKLDIIVTHYDEPEAVWRPFFDMLAMQRNVDFSDISVILVNTCREYEIKSSDVCNYPFKVRIMYEIGAFTGEARYYATCNSDSPWIMYCNCDDMFADVCSLSQILSQFPNDDYDILWFAIIRESIFSNHTKYLNCIDEPQFTSTDGKLYRREFLEQNKIILTNDKYYYDYIFGATCLALAAPHRIAKVTSDFRLYFKSYRSCSLRHSYNAADVMLSGALQRDYVIMLTLREKSDEFHYKMAYARLLFRQYFAVYEPSVVDREHAVEQMFPEPLLEIYRENNFKLTDVPLGDLDVAYNEVQAEVMNTIQTLYNEQKREFYLLNDDISIAEWLDMLEARAYAPATVNNAEPANESDASCSLQRAPERIVVYCGTREVYDSMIASIKSLLCNTRVDKVICLIEDDKLPGDNLPPIIKCINVSNQTYFDEKGPNYNNAWTWMCMMRAVYPAIIPYDKVLSLDVDVVIDKDISELWDLDMDGYYLAGVPEPGRKKTIMDPDYINFGVVIMNLQALRPVYMDIVNLLNRQKLDCPEQTAFNKICEGKILTLPADYNHTVYSHITGDPYDPKILHYAGQKFWKHYAPVKKYADMSWVDVLVKQVDILKREGRI